MIIRRAQADEAEELTTLSFASKRYWQYPERFFVIWRSELTITSDYVRANHVFVCEEGGSIAGYYSLVKLERERGTAPLLLHVGTWLEHMFVRPDRIGSGLGSKLFEHMNGECIANGIEVIWILADPNARFFYKKMGCRYVREFPSSINGRTTPLFAYDVL